MKTSVKAPRAYPGTPLGGQHTDFLLFFIPKATKGKFPGNVCVPTLSDALARFHTISAFENGIAETLVPQRFQRVSTISTIFTLEFEIEKYKVRTIITIYKGTEMKMVEMVEIVADRTFCMVCIFGSS